MEELLALLGLGGGGLMVGNAYNKLGDIGDTAWNKSKQIGDQAASLSNFTGYGVTGPTGNTRVNADGSTQFNLNPDQMAIQNMYNNAAQQSLRWDNPLFKYGGGALNTAQGLLGSIGQDPAAREQDIYNRIRAMQTPEEQRAQTSLGTQLAAQGRTGVTTAQFGGTPEQLAMQKAIADARNAASVQAITLGQQQQQQDTNSASMLSQTGAGAMGTQGDLSQLYSMLQYLPQQALADMFTAGNQGQSFADIARRQQAGIQAEAQMGGLEAQLGAGLGQANLMGNIGSAAIGGGMGMLSSAVGNGASSLWDILKGAYGGLTNG
jgi:hypothetical protein